MVPLIFGYRNLLSSSRDWPKSGFGFTVWVLLALVAGSGSAVHAQPAATTTSLVVSAGGNAVTSVSGGAVVTLTASVVGNSSPVTLGSVKFCDASAAHCEDIHIVGTAQLTRAGTAVIRFRPGVGSHSYKAVFVGTISAASSTSATADLAVTGLSPTSTALSQSGSAGDYTLAATVGGLAGSGPTGTVSFLDSSESNSVLGTAELSVSTSGPNFLNTSSPATGQDFYSIAEGDFNGDGIPDLAVVDGADNNLTILLGDGSGNFTATATSPATGATPSSVAAGDFNGDGIVDLAVINSEASGDIGTATILLGNGDGTFTAAPASAAAGANAGFVVAGDFNGDGILDLAVLNTLQNSTHGTVTILLGHGNGTFTPVSSPETGDEPSALAAGDFNGDGILDLAVANYIADTVTTLLGKGDGTFTPTATSPATGPNPNSIAAADFNGDGILDLALANYGTTGVTILMGNGDGTFTRKLPDVPTGKSPISVAVGDFNGDGIPDLAVANNVGMNLTVVLGKGDGTFVPTPGGPQLGGYPQFVSAGDFNGAGRSDLAVSLALPNSNGNLTVLMAEDQTATAIASGIAVTPVATGTHSVVANYLGDSNNSASISAVTGLTSAKGTPSVSVAASANPSTYGSLTLTATVAGSGLMPTGSINFLDGSTQLGTSALSAKGVAVLAANAMAPGSHSITAQYTGDSDYIAAPSAAYSLTVGQATPKISWVNPAAIAYGTALGATQLNATVSVSGTLTYSPAAGTVLKAGSQTLSVSFTPTDTTDYKSATATVTLTVNQATPTISWATPGGIIYGTALSSAQLNASVSAAGTLTYSPAAGTILKAGSQTLSVSFTPTDTTDYKSATGTVTLTVNQATPTMNWATPAAIVYGTALGAAQLNATVSAAGTLTYSPPAGTGLSAGLQTLAVTFIPSDTVDYTQANASVLLAINQATPTITWAAPAPITYGAVLGSAQLDARGMNPVNGAVVAGAFSYAPPAGTLLAAGTQELSVTFSPADTRDYATPGKSAVALNVMKARQTIDFTAPKTPIVYGAKPVTLLAKTSSGLKVTFVVISGPAKVTGDILTITGAGKIEVAARQEGNLDYDAAPEITWTIEVDKARLTVFASDLTMKEGSKVPSLTCKLTGFVNDDTRKSATTGAPKLTTTATSASKPGKYPIAVTRGTLDSGNYEFEFENGTLTVAE